MNGKSPSNTCLNCGSEISGNYCRECGQSATTARITFRETISQFLSASFSIEGQLLITLKLLFSNPGKLFREFIAGKRKAFYKPVSLFILFTAIYIILRTAIGFDPLEGQFQKTDKDQINNVQQISMNVAKYMVKNINYIMFFLVFAIGLSMKLFFRKRYNLAEYTSVGFYLASVYVILGTIFMFINHFIGQHFNQVQLLILILIIFVNTISFIGVYRFWYMIKYFLVSIVSLLLYLIMSFGFSFLMVSITQG